MFYPSKLGLSFVVLCMMLYLVSLQARSGLLFLVLGIIGGSYVINIFEARRAAVSLKVEPPEQLSGSEGEVITGSWGILNSSSRATGLAEVLLPEAWPGMVRRLLGLRPKDAAGDWRREPLLRIGAIPPLETAWLTPEIRLPRRGVFPFGELLLSSSYPFGLLRCVRRLSVKGEIIVYPASYKCLAPLAAGFEPMVGGHHHGSHRGSSGDQFHGVRPAQSYDPLKLIHWKSSAKGLGLMVKEFDEELSGRVGLLLDCTPHDAPNGEPLLNWAARAVASQMLAALDGGNQVEFISLTQPMVYSVPPFSDGAPVLEALARAEPAAGTLSSDNLLAAAARLPRRAGLCLVLGEWSPSLQPALDEWLGHRRVVTLCLPEPCRGQAGLPPVALRFYGANLLEPG